MAEIAGLVVGVVPVIISIAKSYRTISNVLDALREKDTTARRLALRFKVLKSSFREVCKRLLREDITNDVTWSYIFDVNPTDQEGQGASTLEESKRTSLNHSLSQRVGDENAILLVDCLEAILEFIDTSAKDLKSSLSSEDPTSKRKTVRLLWNKEHYDEILRELRIWIDDFSDLVDASLRKSESIEPAPKENQLQSLDLPLPSSISAVREASKELYSVLERAWSCGNIRHRGHQAGLLVKASIESSRAIRMDVAIVCRQALSSSSKAPPSYPLHKVKIHLEVQSIPKMAPPPNPSKRQKLDNGLPSSTIVSSQVCSNAAAGILSTSLINLNLMQVKSICCHFAKMQTSPCCGFLDSHHNYKHTFFRKTSHLDTDNITLSDALKTIPMGHQLKLAHRLATAVLQFNSTPWLIPAWSLKDITVPKLLQDAASPCDFDELHVIRPLPDKRLTGRDSVVDTSHPSKPLEPLGDLLGVRNWTLCNLGIALIELACQKPIAEMKLNNGDDDVVTARKAIKSMQTPFGFKYTGLARRCLFSDFVPDITDLKDVRVQTAVYNNVVKPLESMIEDFEKMSLAFGD